MATPVSVADIKSTVASPAATLCGRFMASLLKLPALLYKWWAWMFNADGTATAAAKQTLNYMQPGDLIWSASALAATPTPGGRLPCNGNQYASTDYPDLYTAIGGTYGGGTDPDGRGGVLFNVPNAQGRSLASVGTSVDENTVSTTITLGQTRGETEHTLLVGQLPAHHHSYQYQASPGASPYGQAGSDIGNQVVQSGDTGGDTPVNMWHPVFGAYLYIQS